MSEPVYELYQELDRLRSDVGRLHSMIAQLERSSLERAERVKLACQAIAESCVSDGPFDCAAAVAAAIRATSLTDMLGSKIKVDVVIPESHEGGV